MKHADADADRQTCELCGAQLSIEQMECQGEFFICPSCVAASREASDQQLRKVIEENANLVKWCVHVIGPDDVLAAPSHDAAATHAHELNKAVFGFLRVPNDILCFAYAAPWPHGEADHAEAVKKWPVKK